MGDLTATVLPQLATLVQGVRERVVQVDAGAGVDLVHDLRVALRRLRMAVELLEPASEAPHLRVRPLRRAERRLGRVRDEDIVLEWVSDVTLGEIGIPLDPHLERVRRSAERRRQRAAARLPRVVEGRKFNRSLDAIEAWLAAPRMGGAASGPAGAVAPDLVAPVFARVALHRGWHLAWPPTLERNTSRTLHQLRRRLKRLRYGVEFLAPAWEGATAELTHEWHTVLDGLGTWHDVDVAAGRVARGPGHPAAVEAMARRGALALMDWPRWRAAWTDPAQLARARSVLGSEAVRAY